LRQRFGCLEDRTEIVSRFHGQDHVDAFAPGGLAEVMITEGLEVLAQLEGEINDLRERIYLGRIEVEDEIVRLVEMGAARMDMIQFDGGMVRQPHDARPRR
jgi:hypothetical protein